ncbi:DUF2752 domain-containing protein [Streptomyces sp. NPDC059080]|uniref:DUF2752 domain-containing protein n=1 Tax=Streptomyces sp. NPDC059080 TaxID=3346718 RepID=UPI0036AD9EC1
MTATGPAPHPAAPPGPPTGAALRAATLRRAALGLGIGAVGAVYLWHTNPHEPGHLLPGCPLRWATGLLCPLCGGTRLAYDLLHGDVVAAFHDNAALLILGVPAAAYAVGRWLTAGLRGRYYRLRLSSRAGAAVLGIAAVWMLVRNLVG